LAAAYICSGLYASHLQHPNNLLEAAYLPYVLLYFLKTLSSKELPDALYLAITLFFFINSGYPGFPISLLYFFLVILLVWVIAAGHSGISERIKKGAFLLLVSLLFTVVLSLPYLVSVYEILDNFYQAKKNITPELIANGGMTFRSLISLLWPLASMVQAEFYQTDIAWNNVHRHNTFIFLYFFDTISLAQLKDPILCGGLFLLKNALPPNSPVETVLKTVGKTKFVKEPSLFSNNISIDDGSAYPSTFASYASFTRLGRVQSICSKRGMYLKHSDTAAARNVSLSATSFIFDITVPKMDTIVVLQNYSPNWSVSVDSNETKVIRSKEAFIFLPVTQGQHHVQLEYYPRFPVIAFFCSLCGWLTIAIIVWIWRRPRTHNSTGR
jgi:hypothetical protein